MAIARNANSVYVDSTGQVTATGKPVRLKSVTYTSSSAGDAITFKDTDNSGTTKLTIKEGVNTNTNVHDFSNAPIRFPGGIYCSAISASSFAVIVVEEG